MRASTYIRYMGFGALTIGLTAAAVQSQDRPTTQTPSTAAPNEDCGNFFNPAAFGKELAEMQGRLTESLRNIRAQVQQYEVEAREMTEKEMNSDELANLAAQARSASQQAQQLFVQGPGILDSDEGTGWLGLEMTEVTDQEAKDLNLTPPGGVLVARVLPDGPAAKAGLQTNDVILQYDGHDVEGTVQFRRLVKETPPGRSVGITVLRAGHEQKLTVQVGNQSRYMGNEWNQGTSVIVPPGAFNFKMDMPELYIGMTPVLGIEGEDVSGQLGEYFRVPGEDGVLVREVSAGTPAAKAGVKAGDVITRVNGVTVTTLAELRARLRENREEKTISLMVIRQGAPRSITVTLESPEPQPAARSAAL
jgi:serine protease Do